MSKIFAIALLAFGLAGASFVSSASAFDLSIKQVTGVDLGVIKLQQGTGIGVGF